MLCALDSALAAAAAASAEGAKDENDSFYTDSYQ